MSAFVTPERSQGANVRSDINDISMVLEPSVAKKKRRKKRRNVPKRNATQEYWQDLEVIMFMKLVEVVSWSCVEHRVEGGTFL